MDIDATERQEFPWRVRTTRRRLGLTLEDVARRVGVTKGALSRYESGDVRVLGDVTLRAVCGALGLAVPDWLVAAVPGAAASAAGDSALFYCPTPFCRLNRPLLLPEQVRFLPGLVRSTPGAEVACHFCGAPMCSECQECGAALERDSTVCPACGADYVRHVARDQDAMAILQFNAAAQTQPPGSAPELPFWAPLVRRPQAAGAPGEVDAGTGVKVGGPSHGGAS